MIPRMRLVTQKTFFSFAKSHSTAGTVFPGSKTGDFVQESPTLGNQYEDDPLLDDYLKTLLPGQV